MPATEDSNYSDIAVSVVIPCYNQGEYILDALSSVQSCNEPVYEVIIVNDGSTEALTLKVLSYLKDKGYLVIDQKNQGLAAARNNGIKMAKGRYILPLDADNKIRANYIPKGIEVLDKYPEVGVVYGNAELFGDKTGIWEFPDFDVNRMIMGNFIDACAVIRKSMWEDCGGYDSKIPDKLGYEDWDLWLGAIEKGWKFYHVSQVLFDYRFREGSMVSRCNVPENRRQLIRYIYSKHIGLFAANFINVAADKEYAFLSQEAYSAGWKLKCENLEKEHLQLLENNAEVHRDYSQQLQNANEKLMQTQAELQNYQVVLQQTQAEVEQMKSLFEQSKIAVQETQIQLSQMAWELSEYKQLQAESHNINLQLNGELEQSKANYETIQSYLEQAKAELAQAKNLIIAMQTSKFWKLRSAWFKVKKMMGVGKDE
ncbi:glycosyltransferase [Ancylothrix sp. C2]|uniref:glycosyltransferase n=1 Tax=Ancylothrix sp. D3o TaxID=2953691 RepID=UPI0021BAB06B|nr:glycosyltransferase [Ancylothrix sp. D3o]MCT7949159.1 glycosyltransferase [Ancylothrix sp. D3o]